MNCEAFQEILFEHLDGTLSADAEKEARQHVAACERCRTTVDKHRQAADVLSSQFCHSTETLKLKQATRWAILAACERTSVSDRLAMLWGRLTWRLAVGALGLGVVALLAGRALQPGEAPLARSSEPLPEVSIRVPQVVANYTFRMEGQYVVDCLVYRTNLLEQQLFASRSF